jgi:UDP-N-acetylmuramate--alanine ligase
VRGQVDPVFVENWEELPQILAGIVNAEDVILTMGAGNVGQIAAQLPQLLAETLQGKATTGSDN